MFSFLSFPLRRKNQRWVKVRIANPGSCENRHKTSGFIGLEYPHVLAAVDIQDHDNALGGDGGFCACAERWRGT